MRSFFKKMSEVKDSILGGSGIYDSLFEKQAEVTPNKLFYSRLVSVENTYDKAIINVDQAIGDIYQTDSYSFIKNNEELIQDSNIIDLNSIKKITPESYRVEIFKEPGSIFSLKEKNVLFTSNFKSIIDPKKIRAKFNDDIIYVYQAFKDEIADNALNGNFFNKPFSKNRLTWIKPSFLWMMYRSDWAKRKNQERILKISLKIDSFLEILRFSCVTTAPEYITNEEKKKLVQTKKSRVQWDPDRGINGYKIPFRRAIQVGIHPEQLEIYNHGIVKIEDITEKVKRIRNKRDSGGDISFDVPAEYPMPIRYVDEGLINIF